MTPSARHLEYASGYIALGLVNEASDELEAIEGPDRLSADVMRVRVDLYLTAKKWDLLVAVAKELARLRPDDEHGWIYWAYALRELNRVAEAKAVLLEAEPLHGKTCGLLHYNMACYESLLGNLDEARRRLTAAYKFDKGWKEAAEGDSDLSALFAKGHS